MRGTYLLEHRTENTRYVLTGIQRQWNSPPGGNTKWNNCPGKRLAVPYKHKYKHTLWPRTLLFLSVINGKLFFQKPYCKCGQNAHSHLPQTGNNRMWLYFVQGQWVHPYPGTLLSKDKENITILLSMRVWFKREGGDLGGGAALQYPDCCEFRTVCAWHNHRVILPMSKYAIILEH